MGVWHLLCSVLCHGSKWSWWSRTTVVSITSSNSILHLNNDTTSVGLCIINLSRNRLGVRPQYKYLKCIQMCLYFSWISSFACLKRFFPRPKKFFIHEFILTVNTNTQHWKSKWDSNSIVTLQVGSRHWGIKSNPFGCGLNTLVPTQYPAPYLFIEAWPCFR